MGYMLNFIKSLFLKDEAPIGLITLGVKSSYKNQSQVLSNFWHPFKIYCYNNYENMALKNFRE